MSIHLVGGGYRDGTERAVYGPFVSEAIAGAGDERDPVIAVLTVRESADPSHGETLAAALRTAGAPREVDIVAIVVDEGETIPLDAVDGVDGILVGGGLTPAYLAGLAPLAGRIRDAVVAGVPYLGFSAGAMIAPDRAIIGGWRIDGVEICSEDGSEELDELTIEDGLGLIDVTVDVHATQWGNLSRAIAAVDSGAVGEVIAIDESTVLTVGAGPLRAGGAGTVWVVTKDDRGVLVRSMR
ncbi:type 1 glutamine amidotransferase-like domain-containing protein [Planctomonas sp. JC2975]|nr:type 1 glutamine amidotransferase-like domain-containing protein [Planctomonas sp. JC2975]